MTPEEREALFQEIKNKVLNPEEEKKPAKKKKNSKKKKAVEEVKPEEEVEILSLDELNK